MQDPTATVQINPINRAKGRFEVVVYKHGSNGDIGAYFLCDSEEDALKLREALRFNAALLSHVHDYSAKATG